MHMYSGMCALYLKWFLMAYCNCMQRIYHPNANPMHVSDYNVQLMHVQQNQKSWTDTRTQLIMHAMRNWAQIDRSMQEQRAHS